MDFIFKNAKVIDPASGRCGKGDVFVSAGKFASKASAKAKIIDAKGLVLAPGFVDMHVHLREPGQSHKETVASGTAAAAAGGFTSIVAMPNTSPAVDSVSTVRLINDIIATQAKVRVYQSACLTMEGKGEKLAPYGSLKNCGVIALTDDGLCVQNAELMRNAMQYAKMFDMLVMDHCQEKALTSNGQIHEGEWSVRLGLGGWPAAAEDIIVSRDIVLANYTQSRIHLQHISSEFSVEIIRMAKSRKIKVSAEATPHHIALSDECVSNYDTNFKMCPPLRSARDVEALINGLCDGTIDVIATDHAPHADIDKDKEFDYAANGIIGLETAFAVCYDVLVRSGIMKLEKLIELMSLNPAKLLKIDAGTLSVGANADFVLIDENLDWAYCESFSKSRNSPWWGQAFKGRVVSSFVGGKKVFDVRGK